MRPLIIGTSQSPEFLLSCCVPYLQRVIFLIDLSGVRFEIDADCGEVGGVEARLTQAKQDGAFSYSLRTDNNDFESSHLIILNS